MKFSTFLEQKEARKTLVLVVDSIKEVSDLFKDHFNKICKENDIKLLLVESNKTKIFKTKIVFKDKDYDLDPCCTVINLRTVTGIPLAEKAIELGYFVFNHPKTLKLAVEKYDSQLWLEKHKYPVPKTIMVKNEEEVEDAMKKIKEFPMVMKITNGSGGRGVVKCEDSESLISSCQAIWESNKLSRCEEVQPLLIQEFLTSNFDVRVNVIDGKISHVAKRQSDSFRNNLSQDGKATTYRLDKKYRKICEEIAEKLNSEWLGIDLMFSGGKGYIIEINTSPGIKSNKEKLGEDFMKFLNKKFEELGSGKI